MDNIINIMDKDISIIETFYLILIEKLIEKNKELFIIPENKKGPETKAKSIPQLSLHPKLKPTKSACPPHFQNPLSI